MPFDQIGGVGGAGRGLNKSPSLADAKQLAIFGHSFVANQDTVGVGVASCGLDKGFATMLNILTSYSLRLPFQNIFGVSGDTTGYYGYNSYTPGANAVGMVNRFNQVLSSGADAVIIADASNDVGANNFTDAVVTPVRNITAMATAALNQGMAVLLPGCIPRTAFSATALSNLLAVNEQVRRFCEQNRGTWYIDLIPLFCDPTAATLATKTNYLVDGTHPSVIGSYYYAKAIADIINNAIAPGFKPTFTATDVYDATNNPYGNRLPNGMLRNTSGTSSGGNVSGTIASNLNIDTANAPGVTVTCSIAAMADGSNGQQMVFTGTAGASPQVFVDQLVAAGNYTPLVPGDVIEGSLAFESPSTTTTLCGISPTLTLLDGGSGWAGYGAAPSAVNIPLPAVALSGPIRCPRYTVASNLTQLYLRTRIYLQASVAQTATVRLAQMSIRKVNT